MKAELFAIAEDPAFQDMLSGMSESIRTDLIPSIAAIPDAWVSFQESASSAFATAGQALQIFGNDTRSMLLEMHEADEKARVNRLRQIALDKESLGVKTRLAKIDSELSDLSAERTGKGIDDTVRLSSSIKFLTELIEAESTALRERAKTGKGSDESRLKSLDKIRQAEAKIALLRARHAEEKKAATEESARLEQEAADEADRIAHQEIIDRIERHGERLKAEREAHERSLAMERDAIDRKKQLLNGKDGNAAENLLKGQDPAAIRKAFAERQAAIAGAKARRAAANDGDDSPADNKRDAKEIAKARQKALAIAQRQFDRGEADPEAVRNAQQGMANETLRNAVKGGKLSRETAIALAESTREMIANQNELDQISKEVENLKKITMAAAMQGQRRRGQNAGARQ